MSEFNLEVEKSGIDCGTLDGPGAFILDDDDLEGVNGGFAETTKGYATAGYNVVCPSCHASDKDKLGAGKKDPNTGSVEYDCKCGANFICYKPKGGSMYVIMKDKWIAACNSKGYKYTL